MRERQVWSDTLLARPWILVLAVALVVALPVLALGQASENDTRARVKAAQVASAAHSADAISIALTERIHDLREVLRVIAVNPTPEGSLLATAVRRDDTAALEAITDAVYRPNVTSVLRAYIARRDRDGGINDARIVVSSPPENDMVGRRLSDLPGERGKAIGVAVGGGGAGVPGSISAIYPIPSGGAATSVAIAIGIRGDPRQALNNSIGVSEALATLVVELDLPRLFATTARPGLTEADDAYLIDPDGRLVGRSRGTVEVPLRELSDDPFVKIAFSNDKVARADIADPLGGGTRLLASAPSQLGVIGLGSKSGTRIVVVRDTSAVDRETDTVLAQLAAARYVLVSFLLIGTYLVARASRRLARAGADRERLRLARDLHDLLGRSLSVIAIKSQLARRLAPAGDVKRVVGEISDIERIARESLHDVRQAVEGYRQPSVDAELAGARSALAAAGITCTVEYSAGALEPSVDAALAWAVREGVTNVIRHGHASSCRIRLSRANGDAHLEITNDGPLACLIVDGSGLRGLRERAADRGGSADAGPLPQGGFQLRVTLPLRSS